MNDRMDESLSHSLITGSEGLVSLVSKMSTNCELFHSTAEISGIGSALCVHFNALIHQWIQSWDHLTLEDRGFTQILTARLEKCFQLFDHFLHCLHCLRTRVHSLHLLVSTGVDHCLHCLTGALIVWTSVVVIVLARIHRWIQWLNEVFVSMNASQSNQWMNDSFSERLIH